MLHSIFFSVYILSICIFLVCSADTFMCLKLQGAFLNAFGLPRDNPEFFMLSCGWIGYLEGEFLGC